MSTSDEEAVKPELNLGAMIPTKASPSKSTDTPPASTSSHLSTSDLPTHPILASSIPPNPTSSTHSTPTLYPSSSMPTPERLNVSDSGTLHRPLAATKSRSNSQLQSTRPAPPSPAPSRPSSQTFSPSLAPSSSSNRDRAGSTSSSSRGGRRTSGSSHPSRASSKPRPRSALGASSFSPEDESPPPPIGLGISESLAATPIPEDAAASPSPPQEQQVIIRDYAFTSTDPRFQGPGYPLSAPPESSRSSKWGSVPFAADSPDPSSLSKKGWGGFGLLNWRGFMSRKQGSNESTPSPDDDEDDYPLPVPDHDEDDFAFSESSNGSGAEEREDEPWGLFRAAYAFEAMGEHEIDLTEGDIIEVRGRGGGEGWVVAVKRRLYTGKLGHEVGKEGLVPETYLERIGDGEIGGEVTEEPEETASSRGTSEDHGFREIRLGENAESVPCEGQDGDIDIDATPLAESRRLGS